MFKSIRVEERQGYLEYPTCGWNTLIQGTETLTHVANSESLVIGTTRCAAKLKVHVYYWQFNYGARLTKEYNILSAVHRAPNITEDVRTKFET